MGSGVSISGCQSLSAVQVTKITNRITPERKEQRNSRDPACHVSSSEEKSPEEGGIPLLIKEAVQYLSTFGLEHTGLFRVTGSLKKVTALKAKYDGGESVDLTQDGDIDTVASLLKLCLKELPKGVIPESTQSSFIIVYKDYRLDEEDCSKHLKQLIEDLSQTHFTVLHYLCTFFIRVASYSEINKMTLENLSIVLGPSFFRVPFSPNIQEDQNLCNDLLLYILRNFQKLTADRAQQENIEQEKPVYKGFSQKIFTSEDNTANLKSLGSTSQAALCLQDNSFSSPAVTESECDTPSVHEDQTVCSKLRAPELEENAACSRDLPHHMDKKLFDGSSRHGIGILQSKQPRSGGRSDNGKIHEGNQEIETVSQCLPEIWTTKGMTSQDLGPHVSFRGATDFQTRNSPIMRIQTKDFGEQLQHAGEIPRITVTGADLLIYTPRPPPVKEEVVVQSHGCRGATSSLIQTVPGEAANHAEPVSVHRESQSDSDHVAEENRSFGTSRLLFHITDGDNPLLSPRCSIFSQSQRFNLDPESAPSPPSAQQFMMPRSSSRGNCEDPKEPMTVIQLTKQIQNLKKKIRKYEDKFEQEKNYRPSHSDKTSNPEVMKWMNDLSKARKQLKELKLKLSEDQNVPRATLSKPYEERPVASIVVEQHDITNSPMSSVEETVETVWKRLKEKRQLLNLPENVKDMTKKQMNLEKMSLQKCLLYFENIHGRPVTKQERSLMKPLYDRYRIIKQLLSTASLIPTIHEEEDSDDDSAQNSSSEFVLPEQSGLASDEHLTFCNEDLEPAYVSPLDEKQTLRQPALSMSNLHEASMPELLDHLRETRADKKRLRKALREFEEHFLRQTGRSAQKEDRIPMAEEYCEYKQIKAKLRLLEVLISKQDVSKTI
ncbi:protein FAM13C isoform X3 [Bufo gargarizans]|uniref:protein FAM13C isoform X3 n=1 Tax=Bufo gargarizans TaxID=30331 RepID=UPI001CF44DA0|nr:protein FAM13C isoform X3 [Bufo gargarizans]